MVGTAVGPYRIVGTLGAGGMGEVFLADDTRLGRQVALKGVSKTRVENPAVRMRVLAEARAAAKLNHPNIAAIYDVIDADERAAHDSGYIVMEYVAGETLSAQVRRGRLSPHEVVRLGLQLCDALAEAHRRGVIHCDLKPSNIRVTPDGRLKVLDFGLARVVGESAGEAGPATEGPASQSGLTGTPSYMAPERLLGKPATPLNDVYSAGVVFFELLTGRLPFDAPDFLSLAMAVVSEPTPSASDVDPSIPRALSEVVARAMAREPQDRCQSAVDLRSQLARVGAALAEAPTGSVDPVASPAAATPVPRQRRRVVGVIAVVFTVGLLVALGLVAQRLARLDRASGGAAGVRPVVAVLPLANLSGDPSKDYLGSGVADTLMTALADIDGVAVVSRTAFDAARQQMDTRKLASELGAAYLVQGGVQEAADEIQVNVRLLRADGAGVWSGSRRAKLADFFALQADLAEGLSTALRVRVSPQDRRRLARASTRNAEALADYWQGRALLERRDVPGNVDRAIAVFQSATSKDRDFAVAHAGLGEAYVLQYMRARDKTWIDRALAAASEAKRLDPDDAQVRYTLAAVYRRVGQSDDAIRELHTAIDLQPASDGAHRELGEVLAEQGRVDEAAVEFRKAIAIRPKYWRNHGDMGRAMLSAARYDEAADAFRRTIELQPDSSWGYQWLGTVLQAQGKNAEARTQYERAIALAPDAPAYSNLGTLAYGERRYADAVAAYRHALEINPSSPLRHRNLGDAYLKLGKTTEAKAAYAEAAERTRKLLAVNPADARLLGMLAVYEAKLGRRADAAAHADHAVQLRPGDAEALYRRAVVHALGGDRRRAIEALGHAIAAGFAPALARQDDDLALLHGDPAFDRLLVSLPGQPAKEKR